MITAVALGIVLSWIATELNAPTWIISIIVVWAALHFGYNLIVFIVKIVQGVTDE